MSYKTIDRSVAVEARIDVSIGLKKQLVIVSTEVGLNHRFSGARQNCAMFRQNSLAS